MNHIWSRHPAHYLPNVLCQHTHSVLHSTPSQPPTPAATVHRLPQSSEVANLTKRQVESYRTSLIATCFPGADRELYLNFYLNCLVLRHTSPFHRFWYKNKVQRLSFLASEFETFELWDLVIQVNWGYMDIVRFNTIVWRANICEGGKQ